MSDCQSLTTQVRAGAFAGTLSANSCLSPAAILPLHIFSLSVRADACITQKHNVGMNVENERSVLEDSEMFVIFSRGGSHKSISTIKIYLHYKK